VTTLKVGKAWFPNMSEAVVIFTVVTGKVL
jgi:hypothetical protein